MEILTKQEFEEFKKELFEKLDFITEHTHLIIKEEEKVFIKSNDVMALLNISSGTLQHLRKSGAIPCSKLGGILFYDKKEILKIIDESKFTELY